MYGEEYTLVTVADYVLKHTPGNTVSNLSSTRALRDVTRKYGMQYNASAVGEVNVVTKMKATQAVIGGEGNGGVIYPESHYGRDALVGIALFLSHLAHEGKKVSELRATYPNYFIAKNRIDLTPETDVDAILAKVKEMYKNEEINDIDGVKIDFPDKWVHLRKSNTEPIIRVYSEASTMEEADELGKQIMDIVYSLANNQRVIARNKAGLWRKAAMIRLLLHPHQVAHDAVGNEYALFGQLQRFFADFHGSLRQMRLCHLPAIVVQFFTESCFQSVQRHSAACAYGCEHKVVVARV